MTRLQSVSDIRRAVAMPPSGPQPGESSATIRLPDNSGRGDEEIITEFPVTLCSRPTALPISETPPISRRALSRPIRELFPPARTNPLTVSLAIIRLNYHAKGIQSSFYLSENKHFNKISKI
jgi:hypothetical protein